MKETNKLAKMIVPILLIFTITLISINPAMACKSTTTTTRGTAYGVDYTQITGTLNNANYVIRLPDNWNGMLIIGCHAYSFTRESNLQFQFDALAEPFIAQGYAYAASDYGAQGYCVKEGMTATYQLTEFVVAHYHVKGDIFIFGGSMGGEIALLLADKYPHLFSGVLDICGPKDLALIYKAGAVTATSSLSQIRTLLGWPTTVPDSVVQGFKDFCTIATADIELEAHGTPDNNPKAYTNLSPVDNTNIKVPIISLVGGADFVVPLSQTIEYQTALTAAGHSSLYTMIVVPTGGHLDAQTMAQAPAALSQLLALAINQHQCTLTHHHH